MTTLTMRVVRGDFIVTGPDIEPMKFKSRRETRDWCMTHHPGSPITGFGPRGKRKPASDTAENKTAPGSLLASPPRRWPRQLPDEEGLRRIKKGTQTECRFFDPA